MMETIVLVVTELQKPRWLMEMGLPNMPVNGQNLPENGHKAGTKKVVEICRQTVIGAEMTTMVQSSWDAEVSNQMEVDLIKRG
ncbi:hypothetical protein MRB53_001883 [Persea americana]|uniref:Uncharacterized protein n=1 Tax=Persea americana TaxID=3435 RepID=A0ACC2MTW2_PERAE|nr:hypothetical protein MRB53_001883 [Persea americana]